MAESEETLTTAQRLVKANTPEDTKKVEPENEAEEPKEKEIQNEDPPVEQDQDGDSKVEDSLITEELVKVMGLPKGLIGRPLSEVGKSYKESVRWGNENNQELIQLKSRLEQLEGQVTDSQKAKVEKEAQKETEDLLGEIPDTIDDPHGFNEWLKKRDEIVEKKFSKIIEDKLGDVMEKINNNPSLKTAEDLAAKNATKQIVRTLDEQLPEGAGGETLLNAWLDEKAEDYELLAKSGYYKNNPKKLTDDILSWYKAQSYDSLKNEKESDIIKKIHTKTKENLNKVSSTKAKIPTKPKIPDEEREAEGTAGRLRAKLEADRKRKAG